MLWLDLGLGTGMDSALDFPCNAWMCRNEIRLADALGVACAYLP
jgi:hypothetical protein